MNLALGTRIGPYEVVSALGAGGMGEVYRVRDTKLRRDVAIKILPEPLTVDRDRLARFEREAQALAALHHPNIATIFGLEEVNATPAIAMELVDGPTLAERIARGLRAAQRARQPTISVDTKKKELVGEFKNAGRTWRPAKTPQRARVHDFVDPDPHGREGHSGRCLERRGVAGSNRVLPTTFQLPGVPPQYTTVRFLQP